MKTIAMAAGLAVAFASSSMLAPALAQRQVALPAAPGFVIGNQQRAGRQILVELVPAGQSVNRYTKMISLQTFPNVAATVPPGSFMNAFTRRYLAACPRAQAQMMSLGGGKSGMRIQCPLHPNTGKPETVFARAFPVGRDMAMAHVTFKYVALPGDAAWARDYVARVG